MEILDISITTAELIELPLDIQKEIDTYLFLNHNHTCAVIGVVHYNQVRVLEYYLERGPYQKASFALATIFDYHGPVYRHEMYSMLVAHMRFYNIEPDMNLLKEAVRANHIETINLFLELGGNREYIFHALSTIDGFTVIVLEILADEMTLEELEELFEQFVDEDSYHHVECLVSMPLLSLDHHADMLEKVIIEGRVDMALTILERSIWDLKWTIDASLLEDNEDMREALWSYIN